MTPNDKPAMTEFSTEKAARSRVLTCPAKVWVMAPSEYWQRQLKIAGPAKYQSFFDSEVKALKKRWGPVIGERSSPICTEPPGSSVSSGSFEEFAIVVTQY